MVKRDKVAAATETINRGTQKWPVMEFTIFSETKGQILQVRAPDPPGAQPLPSEDSDSTCFHSLCFCWDHSWAGVNQDGLEEQNTKLGILIENSLKLIKLDPYC